MEATDKDVSHNPTRRSGEPSTVAQPKYDPCFTRNPKIIEHLLIDEKRYHSTPGFCVRQSRSRTIWMRRALLNWLRDICVHRRTDGEVLAHTAQLIDRYMHVVPTDQLEYQLVGATCFFISSKLKETVPIPLSQVVEYSANSASEQDILAKELTICILLKWDLTCITPVDFIAPVVEFLEFVPSLRQIIRQAALCIYVKAFHVEELSTYMPSYMAAACILYALNLTVHPDLSEVAVRSVTCIQQLLRLEARKIREVYQILQSCFEPGTVQLSKTVREGDMEPPESPQKSPLHHHVLSSTTMSASTTLLPLAASTHLSSHHLESSDQSSVVSADASLSTSMGLISNNTSFDRTYLPTTSNSHSACSTSSPSSEAELLGFTEIENERPQVTYGIRSRQSMPPISYSQATQHYNQSNAKSVVQNPNDLKLIPVAWSGGVPNQIGPLTTVPDIALKATMLSTDPKLILLAASGIPPGE